MASSPNVTPEHTYLISINATKSEKVLIERRSFSQRPKIRLPIGRGGGSQSEQGKGLHAVKERDRGSHVAGSGGLGREARVPM